MLDADGNTWAFVHERTGEVIPAVTQTMPGGSQIRTPEDQQRYREHVEREQRKYLKRSIAPHFYFAISKNRCGSIKPQTLARIFFLATYLEHGRSELYRTERKLLTKAELPALMRLSPKAFYRFWAEVEGQYLTERDDGALVICNDFFREALGGHRQQAQSECEFQRIFIESLRELYWQTPVAKHRYLGYLFLILPYINWQFNILCKNPETTELNEIEFLTLDEFCDCIGYDKSKRARLIAIYDSLVFTWQGKQQRLCSYLQNVARKQEYFILNPRIIYRGTDPRKVEALGMFFLDVRDKKDNGENVKKRENER